MKKKVVKLLTQAWAVWDRFWFTSDGRQQIHAFRTIFAVILFFAYAMRTPDLSLYFSDEGILRSFFIPILFPMHGRFSLLNYFQGQGWLWFFHFAFLSALFSLAWGFYPRASALAALILHVSFVHRNMAISYGIDSLASYYLLFLCFAQGEEGKQRSKQSSQQNSRRHGSQNAEQARKERSSQEVTLVPILGSVAFRLAQIQLCIIYGYSALEKLKGVSWWRGEALWDVLSNYQVARFDFSWVAPFSLPLILGTYLVLIWEIYFPALVWIQGARRLVLLLGVIMHFGIGICLNLTFFALAMPVTYILFLTAEELQILQAPIKKFHFKNLRLKFSRR